MGVGCEWTIWERKEGEGRSVEWVLVCPVMHTPGYENDRVLRPHLVLSKLMKAPDLEGRVAKPQRSPRDSLVGTSRLHPDGD